MAARLCCRTQLVMLFANYDDIDSYDHVILQTAQGAIPVLRRKKPSGECVYLGEHGCTIHDRAPRMCREYDCRIVYQKDMKRPRAARRRMLKEGSIDRALFERGRKLQLQCDSHTDKALAT